MSAKITLAIFALLYSLNVFIVGEVVAQAQSSAPFCFPTKGTLGFRYLESGHEGVDIWTGIGWNSQGQFVDNDVPPPGTPIFLPYRGTLKHILQGRQFPGGPREGPVQMLIFEHQIDPSFSGLPALSVETWYIHMADEHSGVSYISPAILGKQGTSFPAGTFLGYQGNRKFNRSGTKEDVRTHLHFATKYNGIPNQDPSPYLGYRCQFIALDQNINTTTTEGRLLFNILSAFAEFEREIIRERMLAGRMRAREQGVIDHRPRLNIPLDELKDLYFNRKLSVTSCAKYYKCSRETIYQRLKEIRGQRT